MWCVDMKASGVVIAFMDDLLKEEGVFAAQVPGTGNRPFGVGGTGFTGGGKVVSDLRARGGGMPVTSAMRSAMGGGDSFRCGRCRGRGVVRDGVRAAG